MFKLKLKAKRVLLIALLFIEQLLADNMSSSIEYEVFIQNVENGVEEIKLNHLKAQKAENSINNASSVYAPLFYSTAQGYGMKNFDDFSNNDFYTLGIKEIVGIEKKLKTGTQIATEVSLDFYQNRGDIESWQMNEETYELIKQKQMFHNNIISPEIKLRVTQPLLMNRGGVVEKFILKSAVYQSDVAKLATQLENSSIIADYRKTYVKWLQLSSDTVLMNQIYVVVQKQEKRAQRMFREGLFEEDEYAQFTLFTLQLEENIDQYSVKIKSKIEKLTPFLPKEVEVDNELENLYSFYSKKSLDKISFDSTREGEMFRILEEEAKEYVELRRNLKVPEFNIFGESRVKQYLNKCNKPTKLKRKDLGVNFAVGAQFTMNIGNKKARYELKEAELSQMMVIKERNIAKRNYSENYELFLKYFNLYQNLIEKKNKIIATLQQKAKVEHKKFSQARIDLSDLLETQTSIIEENIALNSYKSNVVNIVLGYLSLIQ